MNWPVFFVFPCCQNTGQFIVVLLNGYPPLDFRNIKARSIFFHHTFHAEFRSASANGLLHGSDPAMRNTIRTAIIISRNNFFFEQPVERKTVGLGLRIGIVVFTFLANRPAVLAVVALGPPAIEDTAIRLPIQCSFLTTCTACLMWSNRIVQPEIRARNQVAGHGDIIIFQEDDLAPESIAARETIHLLNQRLARFISWMSLTSKDYLHRSFRIIHNAVQTLNISENQGRSL